MCERLLKKVVTLHINTMSCWNNSSKTLSQLPVPSHDYISIEK